MMSRQRQQGVALITALLVMALAVVAAVGMAMRGQADIRQCKVSRHDGARDVHAFKSGFLDCARRQRGECTRHAGNFRRSQCRA